MMELYWVWWSAAVVMVVAEMFSGTFYLLAVATGLVAGGMAAYFGVSWGGQAGVAALLCVVSVASVRRWKQGQTKTGEQTNFAYDIGQSVRIASWTDARHARVNYRGAEWQAELSSSAVSDATKTMWRIKKMVGSILIIE